jgi:hypothetical protein
MFFRMDKNPGFINMNQTDSDQKFYYAVGPFKSNPQLAPSKIVSLTHFFKILHFM